MKTLYRTSGVNKIIDRADDAFSGSEFHYSIASRKNKA